MPGFLAGGTALAVLLAARLLIGRPGFLEAISDGFVRFIPLDLFDLAVATLGPLAKARSTSGSQQRCQWRVASLPSASGTACDDALRPWRR